MKLNSTAHLCRGSWETRLSSTNRRGAAAAARRCGSAIRRALTTFQTRSRSRPGHLARTRTRRPTRRSASLPGGPRTSISTSTRARTRSRSSSRPLSCPPSCRAWCSSRICVRSPLWTPPLRPPLRSSRPASTAATTMQTRSKLVCLANS